MIVYTYLLMVASFGAFVDNGVEAGYPNSSITLQASQYNVGYAESNQPNPTFTSNLVIDCDIMRNKETDQDYIYFHNVSINTGVSTLNSLSEPYYVSDVSSNVTTMGNVRLNLTQFSGTFNVESFYKVDSDTMRFMPTFYIDSSFNWSHQYTFDSYDDTFPNWDRFNSPNYTFTYQQFFNEYQSKLMLDTTRNSYQDGYEVGYQDGYDNGSHTGYATGYSDGYAVAASTDSTINTIFNGILNVGLMPINVFLAMLNFEVLGINVSAFCMSLLTIALTVMVIRMVTGGKEKDE